MFKALNVKVMSKTQSQEKIMLEKELGELFDIRKIKLREAKRIDQEVMEAQKDIKLLVLMFSDGIPDMEVSINDHENLLWNSKSKKLIYTHHEREEFIESASRETILRIRPYLESLVKKAKDYFTNN